MTSAEKTALMEALGRSTISSQGGKADVMFSDADFDALVSRGMVQRRSIKSVSGPTWDKLNLCFMEV